MGNLSQEVIFIIGMSVILLVVAIGIISLFLVYRNRQLKLLQEKQLLQSSFEHELLKSQLEIQEANFKNISQEIHDNVGQALSFIKLNINTINFDELQLAKEKLTESKQLLTKVIQDLRDLSRTLNPDFIQEIGLLQAIDQQFLFLRKTGIYIVDFLVSGEPEQYPLQKELVIFRIIQELLNNTVKHSEASVISCHVAYKSDEMQIILADNGKGFNVANSLTSHTQNGLGLKNMVSRMTLINGKIYINSQVGEGTSANIILSK